MQIQRKPRKKSKKLFLIILILIAISIAGVMTYFWLFRQSPQNTTINPLDALVSDDRDGANNIKDNPSPPTEATGNMPAEDIPLNATGSIVINQLDQKNGMVRANASVSNFNTERCVYSFTAEDSKPVVREQAGNCSELTVPQDYFDKIGRYTLTVTAYSSNDKLTISQEIDVL